MFINPELKATFDEWTKPLGLSLPDVWIPLASGCGVSLGPTNRVAAAAIANGECEMSGSLNLNGYANRGDTATLLR